jgi:hypothetical protein
MLERRLVRRTGVQSCTRPVKTCLLKSGKRWALTNRQPNKLRVARRYRKNRRDTPDGAHYLIAPLTARK